jgi:lipid-binding SYLF domain-containing protein
MRRLAGFTLAALALCLWPSSAGASSPPADTSKQEVKQERLQAERAEIDTMAKKTMERLHAEEPKAKAAHDKSYGYAVFDSTKVALGVSGGGGSGVAVAGGKRTYMRMATAGVGASIGAQNYQLVLFFDNKEAFDSFISERWNADFSANAGAGDHGADASGTPSKGVTMYKLADTGLMASADLSGTKFWRINNLNQ